MIKEFKDFALKGNLIEIAVGLILALAFFAVVTSFVDDIISPIIGAIFGQPDFSALTIEVGDAEIRYGAFINALINFLIVAFVLFLIVKAANRLLSEEGRGSRPDGGGAVDRDPRLASQSDRLRRLLGWGLGHGRFLLWRVAAEGAGEFPVRLEHPP